MKINDLQLKHYKEQTETRIVDLLRKFPELEQEAGDRLLNYLANEWSGCQCATHEFMYHIAWLGCERIAALNEERTEIDNQLGPCKGDDDEDNEPCPVH